MDKTNKNNNGLLFASGLITGEALMGIMVALPIFLTGNKSWWNNYCIGRFGFFVSLETKVRMADNNNLNSSTDFPVVLFE